MELGSSNCFTSPPAAQRSSFAPEMTNKVSQVLWIPVLSLLTGVVLIFWLSRQSSSVAGRLFSPITLDSLSGCLLLLAATFCALLVHEAGHLFAAIACHFEVLTISLGVLRITRASRGWRVAGRTRRVFTGSVTAIPRPNEYWRERMMTVVAAGPGATFLSALFSAWLLQSEPAGLWGSFFWRAFFQVNFVIFLLGLIPNSSQSSAQNDAGLLLALQKDGAESNAIFLYHLVLQHQRSGLEPREFPLWLVELMATFQGRPDFMCLYAGMLASWAFDRGDRVDGDLWDARALLLSLRSNSATRHACLANSACFDLVFRNDLDSARAKLDGIQVSAITSPSLQHRALAVQSLACGRISASLAQVAASRSLLPFQLQDRGFDFSLLKRLHASALSWSVPMPAVANTR